jgi:EmrB/QacA subfamily drug resistance transporter
MTTRETCSAGAPAPAARGRLALILATCCLAQFMVTLDVSIVNVALPAIQSGLRFSATSLQWVVNAYTIVFAGSLLLGGRAADLYGRRRVFIAGVALFTAASLLGGLSASAGMLVAARAVQGLSAAVVTPASLAVLGTAYADSSRRMKALSLWSAVAGAGGACGASVGGVLTDLLSWRWILFVNIPVGLVILLGAARWPAEPHPGAGRRLDLPGAFLVTAGLFSFVYGIISAQASGWLSAPALAGTLAGVILLASFPVHQARYARVPVVPLAIFRSPQLRVVSAVAFLSGAALFALFYFLTLYLQLVLRYSPLRTGVAYLPLAVAITVSARAAPAIAGRAGPRATLSAGMAAVAAGLLALSRISPHSRFAADLLGPTLLIGVGQGLVMASSTIAGLVSVPAAQAGVASGVINATRQLGGVIGLVALTALAAARTREALGAGKGLPDAYAAGYGLAFAVAAGASLLGLAAAVTLRSSRLARPAGTSAASPREPGVVE